jgi:hypothetical protein
MKIHCNLRVAQVASHLYETGCLALAFPFFSLHFPISLQARLRTRLVSFLVALQPCRRHFSLFGQ